MADIKTLIGADGNPYPTGWHEDHREVDRMLGMNPHPVFGVAARPIKDTGAGKVVLLYNAVRAVMQQTYGKSYDLIHKQTIGDCVSHGHSLMVDVIKCVQIHTGQRELFTGETATEIMYGLARVQVGNRGCGRGDGAVGAWASRAVTEYGTLVRGKYGEFDLTTYSGQTAKRFGWDGAPDSLKDTIHEHPVKTSSLVATYEEARDSITNGYPVAVCSNWGFRMSRDSEGFAHPQGTWGHCMCFIACDDAYKRPGLLCQNSWGDSWIDGPKRNDQPDGSFWVDADVVNRMLGEKDSFAGSGYEGYPAQDLDYDFLASVPALA